MTRTSQNGAPTASFDALDNIGIYDMFAEDGDDLFDGLDIDLQEMGGITNNFEAEGATMDETAANSERKKKKRH